MTKTLVSGLQFGDEAKGRVSHLLAQDADWSVRFGSGPNAGHTIWHEGKEYKLHQLPAGAVLGKKIALDAGMVIDIDKLLEECAVVDIDPASLYVSSRAHVITAEHLERDSNGGGIGSTRKGIGPTYIDKASRIGIRIGDLKNIPFQLYDGLPPIKEGEDAVYEGAQGIMIDVDYGCYPYVTSSSILPHVGHRIDKIIGVMKGYVTRVGDGPPYYPMEDWLSDKGKEFGATTGRKRKSYWLIMEDIRYALSILNPDEIVVTKLDILDGEEIKVWDNGELITIGNLDNYKEFLLNNFPKIKYFSEAPSGPLIKAEYRNYLGYTY